jgi:hypothetical protein
MDAHSASEHLQVIRTLMERAAVYRRALAPIMLVAGALGSLAAGTGILWRLDSVRAFGELWLGTAAVAVAGAFLLARRQALKEHEPFWSPPTRRVAQALLPPLASGLCLGLAFVMVASNERFTLLLAFLWMLFYGCALHAAGFFMTRGMKLFGWLFIAGACVAMAAVVLTGSSPRTVSAHAIMGCFFGVLQLAFGAYLLFTEKRKYAS